MISMDDLAYRFHDPYLFCDISLLMGILYKTLSYCADIVSMYDALELSRFKGENIHLLTADQQFSPMYNGPHSVI